MVTVCWSVKGGSGVSVTSCALALLTSQLGQEPVLLVDLTGGAALVLGYQAAVDTAGVHDWLAADESVSSSLLQQLIVEGETGLHVLPVGRASCPSPAPHRVEELVTWLGDWPGHVVVDLGTDTTMRRTFLSRADCSVLVLRLCYLAGRAAVAAERADALVIVEEPNRTLTCRDLVSALDVSVVARVPWDAAIAKAVDAASLAHRMPRVLARSLRPLLVPTLGASTSTRDRPLKVA